MNSTQIIPAINARSFQEIKNKIALVEPYAEWIQLDVSDGKFTHWKTWKNPKNLSKIKTPLKIEAHLMLDDIDDKIQEWFIKPIRRIIFHLEASKNPELVIAKCRKAKIEPGIAINPSTPWGNLKPFFGKIRFFQILGVDPGKAGQKFQSKVLSKVIHIRKNCKDCIIEGDGGMNEKTAKKMAKAGANIIVSASAIFGKPDIKKAIEELKSAVNPVRMGGHSNGVKII
jgi:ribulose-phosphate 3-epimerase